jgi:hypothetical protein
MFLRFIKKGKSEIVNNFEGLRKLLLRLNVVLRLLVRI